MHHSFPFTLLYQCTEALISVPRSLGAWLLRQFYGRAWSYEYYFIEYPVRAALLGSALIISLFWVL